MKKGQKRLLSGFIALLTLILLSILILPSPPTEEEWYTHTAEYLRSLTITEKRLASAYRSSDGEYLFSPGELVVFDNGDWIMVDYSSMHSHERYLMRQIKKEKYLGTPARIPVGDAILALGSDDNLYWNTAHICGGIVLHFPDVPASLAEFLAPIPDSKDQWRVYENYASVTDHRSKEKPAQ